jgi:predicted PurR-regulated permease PerM
MLSTDRNELWPVKTARLPSIRAHERPRAAIAVAMILLAAWVGRDFLVALTWAAVIAIVAWPVYVRFATSIGGHQSTLLAPLLFTLLISLVLIGPIALAAHQVAQGSDALAHGRSINCSRAEFRSRAGSRARRSPANILRPGGGAARQPQVQVEWLRGVNAEHITAWTSTLGRRAAASAVSFVATLIALFLVLRDGRMPADHALTVAGSSPGERLARKIADAIRATVNGTVATGGAWLMAAGLAGVGTAVLLENVILPALNGEAARIPFVLVLVGIIGGIGSVRIARSFPRPRDNGGPADHMARVDWYRRVIISDHQIVSLS